MSSLAYIFFSPMTSAADRRIGSKNPQAKLDEDRVRTIKARIGTVEGGVRYSVRRLAAEFGVGKSTVQAIISGRKWRHV